MQANFDDVAYRLGMASFDAGLSLRECAEMVAVNIAGGAGEAKVMGFALGFADGALAAFRKALKPVYLVQPDLKVDR